MTAPDDPESVVELRDADLAEIEIDVADEFSRPVPFEAEPADVAEQRGAVSDDEDAYRDE